MIYIYLLQDDLLSIVHRRGVIASTTGTQGVLVLLAGSYRCTRLHILAEVGFHASFRFNRGSELFCWPTLAVDVDENE